ncbi:MAG: WG repeat-containing protein [Bacteroidota bacterium]
MSGKIIFYSIFLIASGNIFSQPFIATTLPELIPYRKGNLWGYCDRERNSVIPFQFLHARPFIKEFAEVRIDSVTEGIIDKSGRLIASVGMDTVIWVSDSGIIYVELYNNNTIIKLRELSGEWVYSGKYKIHQRFSDGVYIAKMGKQFGLIDKKEKVVMPFRFRSISPPDEKGFIRVVKKNRKTIFIDPSMKRSLMKVPQKYEVGNFHNDLATISFSKKEKSLIGFINRMGKIVIPLLYKNSGIFISGLCEVSNGIKTGFINTKGDTVISFKYGSPINLRNGYINYRKPLVSILYDLNDREIIKLAAYDIDYVSDSLIIISKYGPGQVSSLKYGISDITGKEVWPCTLKSIYTHLHKGLIYVLESWSSQPYYMDYKFNKYYED